MILRDYQDDIVNSILAKIKAGHKSFIVKAPTGSGKTVVFSHITRGAVSKGNRVLIVTDREELLSGTHNTLNEFGLNPGIVNADNANPTYIHEVYVAMAQTLKRRMKRQQWEIWLLQFDIVIFDEAHKQEFNKFFEREVFAAKLILGFTATPKRMGTQRELAADYTCMVGDIDVPELVKLGWLVPDIYYAPTTVDMSNVPITNLGEYEPNMMASRFNKQNVTASAIKTWNENSRGLQTLVFCSNIRHTIEACNAFNDAGISSSFIVSPVAKPKLLLPDPNLDYGQNHARQIINELKTEDYELYMEKKAMYSGVRSKQIKQWKNKEFHVMFNSGILTTGFDYPGLESIMMLRKMMSPNLWLQALGRGSRPYPNKDHFNVFDFGGNAADLGFYNQRREYSLTHKKRSTNGGVGSFKECGKLDGSGRSDRKGNRGCGAYISSGAQVCKFCGHIFEKTQEEIEVELKRYDYDPNQKSLVSNYFAKQNNSHIYNGINFVDIEAKHKARRGSHYQVYKEIYDKGGKRALEAYARMRKYNRGWVYSAIKRIEKYKK